MTTATLSNHEVIETLRSVIQSLIDGQEGFEKIGEKLEDPTLRRYFAAESLKRASFRGDLETVLHAQGVHDIKESGTAGGAIKRTWADVKAKLGGGDHTLLETAEAGEDSAKKAYKDALEKGDLPLPIKQLLDTQYAHIQESHDYVKAERDRRK
jgi:uncharacterized protein (TIGR02284 family)